MNTVIPYFQVRVDVLSDPSGYRFAYDGKEQLCQSMEKVHAFFQDKADIVKLSHQGKTSYLYNGEEPSIYSSKKVLRSELSKESKGAWSETKEGVTRYFIDSTSIAPVKAPLDDGGFLLCWHKSWQDINGKSFGQRYSQFGTPVGPRFQVNTHVQDSQSSFSIAPLSNENIRVIWSGHEQDNSDVVSGIYDQNGDITENKARISPVETP